MKEIHLLLNSQEIAQNVNPSMTLLDYLRTSNGLPGTKIGCREGDCGACTVLVGSFANDKLVYRNITSCLTPLGNVHGKHVVSIEGMNFPSGDLTLVQQLIVDFGGTQCGFCTVGFVVSLTGYCLNFPTQQQSVLDSIDGNICRCTGYKSLEKAALALDDQLKRIFESEGTGNSNWIPQLVAHNILPNYFLNIETMLSSIPSSSAEPGLFGGLVMGGGTDLYVQQHDQLVELELNFIDHHQRTYVTQQDNTISLGANLTATEFIESPIIKRVLPGIAEYVKLIASSPIRNIATMAGNIVNASPIGDFTNIFLALDASLVLDTGRTVKLDQFYEDYKIYDLQEGEIITEIRFPWSEEYLFNFEKVSKRNILDIASVNSSMVIAVEGNEITHCRIAAGGVFPYPLYLSETSSYLIGQQLGSETIKSAANLAVSEISPISDIRGSAEYKSLLLRQLIIAHFVEIFPQTTFELKEVLA